MACKHSLTGRNAQPARAGFGLAVLVVAAGCGSSAPPVDADAAPPVRAVLQPRAADDRGPVSDASAADSASPDAGAPTSDPAPAASAPARPRYEVPVASAELQPFASFEVGDVSWRVAADGVKLEYEFPAALSGKSGQHIELAGPLDAPDHAQLRGAVGSAQCTFSALDVRCDEALTGLEVDVALAKRMLSSRPAREQDLRGQVIESFSADPIGVLSFAPPAQRGGQEGK